MAHHTTRAYRSRVSAAYKTSAFMLVFLLLVMPMAPIFAQEVSPVIPADPIGVSGEGVSTLGPDKTDPVDTNPTDPQPPTKEDAPVDPGGVPLPVADPTPKVDVPTPLDEVTPKDETEDPEPESLTSTQTGPLLIEDKTSTSVKQLVPTPDPSTGALTYSYPIVVPPGRNGMQPDLALQYNSQLTDQDSVVGYGWSLNIPYIKRINKTGSENLYTADYFESSLSGELQFVSGSTYVPKTETGDFLDYQYSSGSWIVTDKKGTQYKFGTSTDSIQDDHPTSPTKSYKWMLEQVIDTNGNSVDYTYSKSDGQIYPDTISYGGIYVITFHQTTRADNLTQYSSVFPVTTNYLIDRITISTNSSTTREYTLSYVAGDNGVRSMLDNIVEVAGSVTLPPISFDYSQNTSANWTTISGSLPTSGLNEGTAQLVDFDADSYLDIIEAWDTGTASGLIYHAYHNDGGNSWTDTPAWYVPTTISSVYGTSGVFLTYSCATPCYYGTNFSDTDGDLRTDLIHSLSMGQYQTPITNIFQNTLSGWQSITSSVGTANIPTYLNSPVYGNFGFINDFNGDGLKDFAATEPFPLPTTPNVHLNQGGNTWTPASTYFLPFDPNDERAMYVDINGDGLSDVVRDGWGWGGGPTYFPNNQAYINTGDLAYSSASNFVSPFSWSFFPVGQPNPGYDHGNRIADINNDGLPDLVYAIDTSWGGSGPYNETYLNTGVGWIQSTALELPSGISFSDGNVINGNFIDINGDGIQEIYNGTQVYQNTAAVIPDLLSTITLPTGGTIDISYKSSAEYRNGSGTLLNLTLPFNIQTVNTITTTDPIPTPDLVGTTTYSYEGGEYFFNGPLDRRFAGFHLVTKEDNAGNITKTYFHQGNGEDATDGSDEYADSEHKIGKIYRVEQFDNSNNPYRVTDNRWDEDPTNRNFVFLGATVTEDYDGSSSGERSKAEEFTYNNANGNLEIHKEWGEASRGTSWSITDTGTDDRTTTYSYISPSSYGNIGLPYNQTTIDHASNVISETQYIYDSQTSGYATVGNMTEKNERISSGIYVNTTYGYGTGPNPYGMIETVRDPNGNTTTYNYDSYWLYPIRVTDGMNYDTYYTYDYATGKVIDTTDPNNNTWTTLYDGLGRVIEEKIPQPSTTQVTKATYVYTDSNTSSSIIQKTDNLNASLSHNSYTYLDGFGRVLQERSEGETGYVVVDTKYDGMGRVDEKSLPYFSSGSSQTSPTGTTTLYTSYIYDPLGRVSSTTDNAGITSYTYDDWKTTVTDANTHPKDFYKDAYGNLVQVDEHDGASTYSTYYEWDMNGKLTKITDALGNVRNFTYDNLGRRMTAEDLHDPSDTSFGTYTYSYYDGGQMRSQTYPSTLSTTYTYDALNRISTEDSPWSTGVEITYSYDSCLNGIGRLCSAALYNGVTTIYDYDEVGNMTKEDRTASSTVLITHYTYDYQSNLATVTTPDSRVVTYTYNVAGLPEAIDETISSVTNPIVTNFDYAPNGKAKQQDNGNGVTIFNDYNALNLYRVKTKQTKDAGGAYIQNINYGYDAVGNITNISDISTGNQSKTAVYTYDDLDRLIEADVTLTGNSADYNQRFTYDAIGNIVDINGISYSYDGNTITSSNANPHAATTIGTATYSYDDNGNLLSDGIGGVGYDWDYKNQLDSYYFSSSSALVYKYDHTGNRVSTYDGWVLTLYPNKYYDADQNYSRNHIYNGSQLIATIDQNGTHWVSPDHLTGTNLTTDGTGYLEQLIDYYPFGNERINTSTGSSETFNFTGKQLDAVSGLNYFGARYYKSDIGRFISEDPVFVNLDQDKLEEFLSDPQAQNSYAYARNNPLTNIDPDGKWIESAADLASLGLSVRDYKQNPSLSNALFVGLDALSLGLPIPALVGYIRHGDELAKTLRAVDKVNNATQPAESLMDAATVCRGGSCSVDSFIKGSNEYKAGLNPSSTDPLTGISVNVGSKDAAIKHLPSEWSKAGFTIENQIKNLQGNLISKPTANNPLHSVINGLNGEQLQSIFKVENIK